MFANSEEIFEQNIGEELVEPNIDVEQGVNEIDPLGMLFDENMETEQKNFSEEIHDSKEVMDFVDSETISELAEEPKFEELFEDVQIEDGDGERSIDEAVDSSFEVNSDEIEFSNDIDVTYGNSEYDEYGSEISVSSGAADSSESPAFSPVMHTPISEATDLVSLDSI